VIAITTYSDQIPVDLVSNEPPQQAMSQVNEDDEEEQSDFALLLAGLLQDVQLAEVSENDSEQDALAAEKIKDENRLNIYTNEIERNASLKTFAEINGQKGAGLDSADTDIDPIDAALDSKHQNILSADHLFNSSFNFDDANEDTEIFQLREEFFQESGAQNSEDLAELASANTDLLTKDRLAKEISSTENFSRESAFISAKAQNDAVLQSHTASELAAKQKVDEAASLAEKKANAAKESQSSAFAALGKNEKAERLSAGNRAGEDNSASFNRQGGNPGKLDEYRRGLRRDKVSFEVRDLRTAANVTNNSGGSPVLADTSAGRVSGASVQEISLDLRMPDYSQQTAGQSPQAQITWDVKAPAALENMLARELHNNFNGDIVRHASMILRNGGEGIIRLSLHPETLGNVKIHLKMAENKITGFVEVESSEAMNAFRREIASLEQAFREQGFAEASLDLSLAADGAGADRQEFEGPSFAAKTAASGYEESYEQETAPIVDVFFGRQTGSVNMLA